METPLIENMLWALLLLIVALPAPVAVVWGLAEPSKRRAIAAFVVDTAIVAILFWWRTQTVTVSLLVGVLVAGLLVSNVYVLGRLLAQERRRRLVQRPGPQE